MTDLEEWLSTRPPAVQAMFHRFPPGTRFLMHGKVMHVVAYTDDAISVTPVDPFADYQRAVSERQPVCACCTDKLDLIRLP